MGGTESYRKKFGRQAGDRKDFANHKSLRAGKVIERSFRSRKGDNKKFGRQKRSQQGAFSRRIDKKRI